MPSFGPQRGLIYADPQVWIVGFVPPTRADGVCTREKEEAKKEKCPTGRLTRSADACNTAGQSGDQMIMPQTCSVSDTGLKPVRGGAPRQTFQLPTCIPPHMLRGYGTPVSLWRTVVSDVKTERTLVCKSPRFCLFGQVYNRGTDIGIPAERTHIHRHGGRRSLPRCPFLSFVNSMIPGRWRRSRPPQHCFTRQNLQILGFRVVAVWWAGGRQNQRAVSWQ